MGAVAALPFLFPIFLLAVIFGFIALIRYLRYRENMMYAERGITPPNAPNVPPRIRSQYRRQGYYNPYRHLRGGIITSLVGLAILLGLWTLGTGPWLLGGLIPLAVGLGELLTFVIATPTRGDDFGGGHGPGGPGGFGGPDDFGGPRRPHDGNDDGNF